MYPAKSHAVRKRNRLVQNERWEYLLIFKQSIEQDTRSIPNNKNPVLLNDVAGPKVARIERLAPRESLVLAMVEADAVFAEPPAEIDLFIVDQGRKVQQTNLKIFDEATRSKDAV